MKRIITKQVLVAWLYAMPAVVYALGLGQLELESGLNQPFEARIELLSATADELSSLNIGLADTEAFQRAGVERLYVLNNLRFELQETETGPDYIRVYSDEPIREPYLNFLVEAAWSNGRLLREFTVLLDPPLYDPTARRTAVVEPEAAAAEPVTEPATTEAPGLLTDGPGAATGAAAFTAGEYGPTAATDTLWSIASSTRPDDSISVQQMMIAILRANPDAFLDNNINGLKRGQVLRIPARDEVAALSLAEAVAEAGAQNAAWQESRGYAAPPERPITAVTPAEPFEADAQAATEDTSELRLVAAAEAGAGQGAAGAAAGGAADASLALANEQVEALSQENLELKDRLTEAESIIEDLRRLIALKDDELAALQQQAGETIEPVTEPEQPVESAPAEAVTEEPVTEAGVAEAPTGEAEETAEPPVTEEPPQETPAEEPAEAPAEVAPAPVAPPEAGWVDQILGIVMANIVYVGAGAGGLVLVVAGFVFLSRRKAKATDIETEASYAEATMAPEEVEREAVTAEPEEGAEAEVEVEAKPAAAGKAAVAAPAAEPAAAAAPAPEEDPLAEVNVFLAYEHFDQAEEFVRDAIAGNPNNLDFHTKLLEVFYASGDKAKYEAAAKVLHDKADGAGPHWDMALAMWSEMSPNRALFAAGGVEEAETAATAAAGGVLDLTAGEAKPAKAAAAADMSLDFNLGDATDVPAKKSKPVAEDVLDLTAAATEIVTDTGEDLLDVTAAVGLEPEPEPKPAEENELVLDITSGTEQRAEENLLDISTQGGESLLDVTAQADTRTLSGEEDLLDVTSATSAGADADELLEIESAPAAAEKDEHVLDFDIGGLEAPAAAAPGGGAAGSSLELDAGGIELESPADDNVIEFEGGLADTGLSLDNEPAGAETAKSGPGDASGMEIDLSIGDVGESQPALELETGAQDEGGIEFDLSSGDDAGGGLDLGLELAEADVDEDSTVFVPRSADVKEQSAEDEIATKLDLAKAYVELGDKDSARGILDEVIRDGNAQQKATAKELLKQVK
jgi:pilus assembly protein FimV